MKRLHVFTDMIRVERTQSVGAVMHIKCGMGSINRHAPYTTNLKYSRI